jgi:phenylacetate-coenzyme A ligase PaaK-like adenylate-forming protein
MFEKVLPIIGKFTYPLFAKGVGLRLNAPKEEIEAYQLQKLRQVVYLAYQTPFYRGKFNESKVDIDKINSIEDLKIETTREDVEKYKDQMRRKNCRIYFTTHTSGSTGNPLYVDVSHEQLRSFFSYAERNFGVLGLTRKHKFLTIFPFEAPSYTFVALLFGLLGRPFESADFYDLDDQLKKLRNANIIVGYATRVLNLIQNCREKDVENLEAILYSSEPLPESAKEFIEEKTPAKVYGGYGSIESMAPIAFMCKRKNYHLNPELFIMETNKNNDVLLTCLDPRRATILLRYKLGDKVFWKNCNCGITFPAFDLQGKFRHLTSQRIEAAMYSSWAFRDGLISPFFDIEEKVEGGEKNF